MSWAEYLSNLQRDGLKHAAICGLEGANWFLVTEGSNVSSSLGFAPQMVLLPLRPRDRASSGFLNRAWIELTALLAFSVTLEFFLYHGSIWWFEVYAVEPFYCLPNLI